MNVPESKLKELSKEYRFCKDVSLDECIGEFKRCPQCLYSREEDGWGSGNTPSVCVAFKK